MLRRAINYLLDLRDLQRIAIGLSKGGTMMQARNIDLTNPASWEFSGFSQNGEDGILDVLRRQLVVSNRYFVEIGAADGIENNTAWLLVAEKWGGLMIEGNSRLVERARRTVLGYSIGAEIQSQFVTISNVGRILGLIRHKNPDILSLDIDGNDYYIVRAIMESGLRPKIFVVEYNSAYGPERSQTVEYQDDFIFTKAHTSHLYYGASISGWRKFFEHWEYRFVTVDRNGVNGFFVAPEYFDPYFLNAVAGLDFAENQSQLNRFGLNSEGQYRLIANQPFVAI